MSPLGAELLGKLQAVLGPGIDELAKVAPAAVDVVMAAITAHVRSWRRSRTGALETPPARDWGA